MSLKSLHLNGASRRITLQLKKPRTPVREKKNEIFHGAMAVFNDI